MKQIFHVKAKADIKTNKRHIFTDVFENISAGDVYEATKIFVENWKAENIELNLIEYKWCGTAYKVTKQPEGYSVFGFRFNDDNLDEIRVYPEEKTFHFKTKEPIYDLNIGLNWTEKEFNEIVAKLTEDLGLE